MPPLSEKYCHTARNFSSVSISNVFMTGINAVLTGDEFGNC